MGTPSPDRERGPSPRAEDDGWGRKPLGGDREPVQDNWRANDSSEAPAPEGEIASGGGGDAGWAQPPPLEGQRPVVFINNIAMQTENRDLEEIYRKFGNLKKVAIMYDPHSRESRGFAFLDYETVEEAQEAVNHTANLVLHGRELHAELARRGRPRTPTPGRYCGLPKRAPRGPPPGRYDNHPRDQYRTRSPDYRDSYRRRDFSPARDRSDRHGGYGRDRDRDIPRDPYPRDPYARDPHASRGGGHDRHSPPASGYDRRSPPRSSRHDRY